MTPVVRQTCTITLGGVPHLEAVFTQVLVPIYQMTWRLCFMPVCFTPFLLLTPLSKVHHFLIYALLFSVGHLLAAYVLLFKSYFLVGMSFLINVFLICANFFRNTVRV